MKQVGSETLRYEVHWVKAQGCCMGEPHEDKYHGTFNSLEEAQKSVTDWWKKNNFTPNYVREMRDEQSRIWWDYGPHFHFYMFVEVKNDLD